jgi:hypothetical protein
VAADQSESGEGNCESMTLQLEREREKRTKCKAVTESCENIRGSTTELRSLFYCMDLLLYSIMALLLL